MTTDKPPRRWVSFNLRTLFVVVTILAIPLSWIAWQRRIVQERSRVLQEINAMGGFPVFTQTEKPLSEIRQRFGDRPFGLIVLPEYNSTPDDLARVQLAFPEARVVRKSRGKLDYIKREAAND